MDAIRIANDLPFVLIAGPCQIESSQHAVDIAGDIAEITSELNIGFIYKSSFDKANRTSIKSKRGIDIEKAIGIFDEIKRQIKCPILTDIHQPEQAAILAPHVDVLQIPALLCRQTDLIVAAATTGKCVNIKKGQFLAPHDISNAVGKCTAVNNANIMLTERGTSFGYNMLVNDMRGLQVMKLTGYPVIFDATHSVQQPGGLGTVSGGQREFIETLARAAIATGIAGLFIETHNDPDNAPSDGPCMLPLSVLKDLLVRIKAIDDVVKSFVPQLIKIKC